jgi:hypothetical protein
MNGQSVLDRGEAPDSAFARRAAILILRRDISEVGFIEESRCFVARCLWLWHQSLDARLFALKDFLTREVAAIG